ncbi:MAG: zf-HC2 domain-containing protein [Blastocatellia bacterium]|nr:zf-HC2 domain-containing protein [Blastocatellia bacterium]MCS7157084.1 zf-HC2 domain-containing protein [Blastocatellia bacterium]MCX7752285.1 zf-HC2 domain-containing protein [Blastocatellia bacterium]MDW8167777.1 zf-HC2 domain-containing protein [Acidobacteriota bacterium]MDW8256598.1 zf-HC2 domain-containing protein [Acidobacteriota bacterium]
MSCAKYQDRLSDYIDGGLSGRERLDLERHLRECESCRTICEDLLYIHQLSRELPEYEPSPQLWERIAAAIAAETRAEPSGLPMGIRRWWARSVFAAAAAAAIIVLAGTLLRFRSPAPESQEAHISTPSQWGALAPPLLEVQPTGLILVYKPAVESEIVQQRIEALERQIQRRRPFWDAETEACFRRALETVERSLAHCRQGLERDPGNIVLRELYLGALKAKLELLKRFSEL